MTASQNVQAKQTQPGLDALPAGAKAAGQARIQAEGDTKTTPKDAGG